MEEHNKYNKLIKLLTLMFLQRNILNFITIMIVYKRFENDGKPMCT